MAYVDTLKVSGIDEERARAHAAALDAALRDTVATKDDITVLQEEMAVMNSSLREDMASMNASLREDMAALEVKMVDLRAELKEDLILLRSEFKEDVASLKEDMASLKAELKSDIHDLDAKLSFLAARMDILQWLVGGTGVSVLLLILRTFLA
jgi:uncharacterized protein involved in exopolysaccharide biosynthesis